MNPTSVLCRLCLCSHSVFKALEDENGQHNQFYDIAAKYFDPKLLTRLICLECWHHIDEFYTFQKNVLDAHAHLVEMDVHEPIVKLELEILEPGEDNPNLREDDINMPVFDTVEIKDNPFNFDDETPNSNEETKDHADSNKCVKKSSQVHQNHGIHTCYICRDRTFKSARLLVLHKKLEHNFQCPHCPMTFRSSSNIPVHVKNIHPKEFHESQRKHQCNICGNRAFKSARLLLDHTKVEHNGHCLFQCPHCPKTYTSNKNFTVHVKNLHRKEFNKSKIIQPLLIKTNDDPKMECNDILQTKDFVECNTNQPALIEDNDDAEDDCKNLENSDNLPLSTDDKISNSNKETNDYEKHDDSTINVEKLANICEDEDGRHKCAICGDRTFKSAQLLLDHTYIEHNGHRIPQCPWVKENSHSDNLPLSTDDKISNSNKETYEYEKHDDSAINVEKLSNICEDEDGRHKCTICGNRTFKSAQLLLDHTNIEHNGQRIPKCPYCPKTFRANKNIPRHIKNLHLKKFNESKRIQSLLINTNDDSQMERKSDMLQTKKFVECNINQPALIEENYDSEDFENSESCDDEMSNSNKETNDQEKHHDCTKNEEKSFTCTICGDRQFKTSQGLLDHTKIEHNGQCLFKCPHCPTTFIAIQNIRRHIRNIHPEEYGKSKYIQPKLIQTKEDNSKNYDSENSNSWLKYTTIRYSKKTHESDTFIAKWKQDLECISCKNTFKTFTLLYQHFKLEHPNDKFYVVCCDRNIRNRFDFVEHIQLHMDPNAFKCKVCEKPTTSTKSLRKHMLICDIQERPFECKVCQKRFKTEIILKTHSDIHNSEKSHVCTVCDKAFPSKQHLAKHGYNTHRAKKLCEQCGVTCYDSYVYKEHLLKHAGIKWPCDICGVELSNRTCLNTHKRIRHPNSSTVYVCSECGKKSISELALKNHKRYVHGDKRNKSNDMGKPSYFQCKVCNKAFRYLNSLREHKQMHSDEPPHQCPYCPTKIKAKGNLQRHLKHFHPNEIVANNSIRPRQEKIDLSLVENEIVI